MDHSYGIFFGNVKEIGLAKKFTYIVIFERYLNVQLGGKLLKVHYPTFAVILGVENTLSLLFNDESKIPIVCQIIADHKIMYNIFGSVI